MRDDYNEKTMLGQKVQGYICIEPNEQLPYDGMVFMDACESIGLPIAASRNVKPLIYLVEGTSQVKDFYVTETERAYYLCDNIHAIRMLSTEDIIDIAKVHASYAQRFIAFYPFTNQEAVILARVFKDNYFVLNSLSERYENSEEIQSLLENAKEEMLNAKVKKFVKE